MAVSVAIVSNEVISYCQPTMMPKIVRSILFPFVRFFRYISKRKLKNHISRSSILRVPWAENSN